MWANKRVVDHHLQTHLNCLPNYEGHSYNLEFQNSMFLKEKMMIFLRHSFLSHALFDFWVHSQRDILTRFRNEILDINWFNKQKMVWIQPFFWRIWLGHPATIIRMSNFVISNFISFTCYKISFLKFLSLLLCNMK